MQDTDRHEFAGDAGRLANYHGLEARRKVESRLRASGYKFDIRVPLGSSIYGTRLIADLVVTNAVGWPDGVIVAVISQASSGSADHKFPYLVANIKGRFPCPTIVVLVGDGFSSGAMQWLREQVDGRQLIAVTTLEHLESSLNRPMTG